MRLAARFVLCNYVFLFFLKTAKHDTYSGSFGTFARMKFHRRKVANGIYGWNVIAVYVETAAVFEFDFDFIF